MKKDLIVTTVSSNYNWVDIKNWAVSLRNTKFEGDVLILAYNFTKDRTFINRLEELGITVICPEATFRGEPENNFIWHSGEVNRDNANKLIHNVRLFHLWQYFVETNLDETYERVVFTDGRDVVFQTNPSKWLDANMKQDILVPSEGVTYANESWNRNNLIQNYGVYVYEYLLKDRPACNVGTFACKASLCRDLCLTLYLMSNNTGHADQPSFNIITSTLLKDRSQWVDYRDSWALQIGAIQNNLEDYVDFIGGVVYSKSTKEPYCLVHQYDRVPKYKEYFDTSL